jgi:hypothetical protein
MKRSRLNLVYTVATLTVVLAGGRAARAESGYDSHGGHHRHHFHGHGHGFVGGGYGYHSSTALEGALRGKAAVIDAVGNFQVNSAQAAILFEQARAFDRENDLAQVVAFRARLEIARKAREAERVRKAAQAAEGRLIVAERQAVVHRNAYRLSESELNAATGAIDWPAVFGASKFEADRVRIEELFARQVRYGADAGVRAEIVRTSERMARALRSEISLMPRAEYLAAQKFLMGLRFAS